MDEFTQAYIECALWSSHDESDEYGGDNMDANYSASDIAPETLAKMVADCGKFQADNIEHIAWDNLTNFPHRHSTHRQAGHDFWLTRNGHGAGFWDGDWIEPAATKLDESAKAFGEFDLYIGDDGRIYA